MSTCNRLDLETLGCRPIILKNLPGHWRKQQNNIVITDLQSLPRPNSAWKTYFYDIAFINKIKQTLHASTCNLTTTKLLGGAYIKNSSCNLTSNMSPSYIVHFKTCFC
jgi:hypothetical protein